MNHKLWFLTKMSLNKKIKTKWFIIANVIFLILIVGLLNIDSVIKAFGGKFNEKQEIIVIDNMKVFDDFKNNFEVASKYVSEYDEVEIINYDKSYDDGIEEVKEDDKVLILIDADPDNYLTAKIVSNDELGTITGTIIRTTLNTIRSEIVLTEYNITKEMFSNVNKSVDIETVVLNEDNMENGMMISTVMQVITFPVFMLIIFLVQMIGAEVNEEKTTRSMEIIISNVSPKTHFLSKVIAANAFVLIQGLLLLLFVLVGGGIRLLSFNGDMIGNLGSEIEMTTASIDINEILNSVSVMLPVMLLMIILTFIAYSLLAGILASMTTNMEDYQQLQTPIVVVSLVGYYLSVMAGMFKGSIFIRIMSYLPFVSSMLSPTLYILGEIKVYDLIISILLLVGAIYLLIKYGLKIYKVGILNYSGTGLWKKMFKAMKGK